MKREYLALNIDRALLSLVDDVADREPLIDRLIEIFEQACAEAPAKAAKSPSKRRQHGYTAEFEAFWVRYPKGSKFDAAREWEALTAEEKELVHPALDWQIQTDGWTRDNGRFRLDAERWLKRKRWEDKKADAPPLLRATDARLQRMQENQRKREEAEAAEVRKAAEDKAAGRKFTMDECA